MSITNKKWMIVSIALVAFAILFTILVKVVDVKEVALLSLEDGSKLTRTTAIGFGTINELFHFAVGCNKTLYKITDYVGYLAFLPVVGFGLTGLIQWIKRKSIAKVDYHILVLGVFYIVVLATYFLFDFGAIKINTRAVLIGSGESAKLENGYPSSSTMLAISTMPTLILELRYFVKNKKIMAVMTGVASFYLLFLVIGRIFAGVHWLSDILGAIFISLAYVFLYVFFTKFFGEKLNKESVKQ